MVHCAPPRARPRRSRARRRRPRRVHVGPLIAFAAAPALAIAFWRNALAVGVLGPISLFARRAEYANLARREPAVLRARRVALAAHFAAWMPSIRFTTVAASTALVATQPVWQGLISVAQGRRLRTVTWAGIGVAVLGAVLATGADFGGLVPRGARRPAGGGRRGDGGGGYTAFGERARVTLSTTTYTTICYSVCACSCWSSASPSGQSLGGYPGTTWLAILGLVAGAQLLGHTMFNYALRRVSATTISVLILLEVPGAAPDRLALARPGAAASQSLPGLALLMVGVADRGARRGARRPPGTGAGPCP